MPISYTFASTNNYYVDPATGILIDYDTTESRVAGVDIAGSFQPLAEVWNLSFAQDDDSIAAAKADAADARGQLFWLGTILPWALMIGGVLLALFGLRTTMKARRSEEIEQRVEEKVEEELAETTAELGRRPDETVEEFKDRQ